MKIFYLSNIRFPTEKAHGIQIAKMCESFSLGNEVVLIIPWRFNYIKEDAFDYYDIEKNFKIIKLPSLDLIILNIPKIGFIIQSLTFSVSAFIYFLFKKTDIIYTRDLLLAWLLSFIKKNVFLEIHTLPFWLNKQKLKRIKGFIVITDSIKSELIKKGIARDKILIAPDGVDTRQFDIKISKKKARQRLSLPLNKRIILYTGHLYKWKGVYILAEAVRFLSDDCLIVLVGGTKDDEKKFRIKNQKLNNIMIVGHRSHSEIPYWLKAADVLILPNSSKENISKYWTSPMKMFEYMSSRRPIVASSLPSVREVLDENNAILVKPDSPINLVKGIEKALKNTNFSVMISKKAIKDVRKYEWEIRKCKIIEFINKFSYFR
ncbi:glycosyltransferase family 4 protein [Patescibacteria group bacterium]